MQITSFFARSVHEQPKLCSSINFAIHKIESATLTAGMVKNTVKGSIERFPASGNAFSFMSSVKGTPVYWIPTYFLTLSCDDLRCEELSYIDNKLNILGLSDKELKNLSYQERCNLLNNNPVLVARHFQYRVEVFLKEIIFDGPLGKKYAIHNEFQEGGSPHVHWFIWIFNDPNIENETASIEFIEKTINTQLSDHLKDPELSELVKTYQVHARSRTCLKYNKNECHFSYGQNFTEKTIIASPGGTQHPRDVH